MKKPLTNKTADFIWDGTRYSIPIKIIKKYRIEDDDDTTFSIEEVFSDLLAESGEPGVLLRGLRAREGLTQEVFAQRIGVTQANLSAMENGRRSIGKEIAKRIGDKFKMDYRLFL